MGGAGWGVVGTPPRPYADVLFLFFSRPLPPAPAPSPRPLSLMSVRRERTLIADLVSK